MTMILHHFSAGSLCPWSARLVNGEGPVFGRGSLVCHVLAIETDRSLLLVDTGLGTADLARPERLGRAFASQMARDPNATARAQLAALGFGPSNVTDIVCTHLDLDHAGG